MTFFLFPSAWAARSLCLAFFFTNILQAADYGTFCNGNVYGKPVSVECIGTLARFPIHDTAIHYFVEQQLRTRPPAAVWNAFKDPRPRSEQQSIVQLPKWISSGTCNVALFSFTHEKLVNSAPALAWSDIFSAGLRLDRDCLVHNEGGAVVVNGLFRNPLSSPNTDTFTDRVARVKDTRGGPGLSLFMWQDGSPFEFLVNHEGINEFPTGLDPVNPSTGSSILTNATFMTGLGVENAGTRRDGSALYL